MSFRVDLDIYRGPLDLLLYLVRKHELEIHEISIRRVTEQYLDYLEVLKEIDIDAVGDFIELAGTLMEIKSREVLPQVEEAEEPLDDPREELVQRLLEYKKYKDAASVLEERGREWQQRFPRLSDDLPPRKVDPSEQPIREVELWDLVSAFGRMMRANQSPPEANIVYDDTPVHVYMERLHADLASRKRIAFSEFFGERLHKSAMIGMFLAILELVRHHHVTVEQDEGHGEILVYQGEAFDEQFDGSLAEVDYDVSAQIENTQVPKDPTTQTD